MLSFLSPSRELVSLVARAKSPGEQTLQQPFLGTVDILLTKVNQHHWKRSVNLDVNTSFRSPTATAIIIIRSRGTDCWQLDSRIAGYGLATNCQDRLDESIETTRRKTDSLTIPLIDFFLVGSLINSWMILILTPC